MLNSAEVVAKVLPVLFIIAFGSWLRRREFLSERAVKGLKDLVVNVALPSLLFLAFSSVKFELTYLAVFLVVFGACLLMLGVGKGLGNLLGVQSPYFAATFTGFEAGMLGYSIFVAVFGAENTYKFAVIDLGQVTFVFFILVGYLIKMRDGIEDFGTLFRSFVKSPVIVAIFAGIISGRVGLTGFLENNMIAGSFIEAIRLLSTLTVPLIVLVIGYELKLDLRNLRLPVLAVVLRAAIMTLLAFILNALIIRSMLGLDRIFQAAFLTMFILPPPFVIPLFMGDKSEEDMQFVLNTLSLHTLVSLVLFIGVMIVVM